MESQFGLLNVWAQGDWVARAVTLLLLGMSLASWMVIVVKALNIVRGKRLARLTEEFWRGNDFADGLKRLGSPADNPFHELAVEGREAAAHLHQRDAQRGQLQDSLDVSDWVTRCLRNSIDHTTAGALTPRESIRRPRPGPVRHWPGPTSGGRSRHGSPTAARRPGWSASGR